MQIFVLKTASWFGVFCSMWVLSDHVEKGATPAFALFLLTISSFLYGRMSYYENT